ncbi:MAG: hypothetical protein KQH57_11475 [Actinomycetales bacterium]|nr:hypothetical protein [Actinomycetales bacterium]
MTVAAVVVVSLIGLIFIGLGVWAIAQIFPAPRSGPVLRGHEGATPQQGGPDRRDRRGEVKR